MSRQQSTRSQKGFIMPKKLVVAGVVILALAASLWFYTGSANAPTLTANTPVATGVSLVFNQPLAHALTATVKNSQAKVVTSARLGAGGQRYNLALAPGVYVVSFTSSSAATILPPPPATVTVTNGALGELAISLSAADK